MPMCSANVVAMAGKSVQCYLNEEELRAFYELKTHASLHNVNPADNNLVKIALYELYAQAGIELPRRGSGWKPDMPQVMPNKAAEKQERAEDRAFGVEEINPRPPRRRRRMAR